MELFLGVEPMSQYDAAALPMIWSFTDKPNFSPYQAITPGLTAKSPATANTAAPSAASASNTQSVMTPENMSGRPDQADSQKLNEELWKEIKGPNVPMPAPKHHVMGEDNDDKATNKQNQVHW